uniref:MARVEL domain-containing protein n=1 Tax=Globisporangium ultimum (strain ATCC 200006 / CBS 805.95 / DAOM BR144) TaxID=431595 RepID=K3WQQ1_GLOUD
MSPKLESFKPLLRFVSAGIAVLLFILSCAGFEHVSASKGAFGGASSFGCICFLGCCFSVLLALAELNWGLFYFFFGFLRYRIGRAVLFAVSGIMIALIGKDLDDQCRCKSYVILIIEGAACVGVATLHLFGVFVFGNNAKPSAPPSNGSSTYQPSALVIPPLPKQPPHSAKTDSTAFEPIVHAPPSTTARGAGASSNDPNRPAWMNA